VIIKPDGRDFASRDPAARCRSRLCRDRVRDRVRDRGRGRGRGRAFKSLSESRWPRAGRAASCSFQVPGVRVIRAMASESVRNGAISSEASGR
jgi:hypothetical protein